MTALRDNEVVLHYSSRLEDDLTFRTKHAHLAVERKEAHMLELDGVAVYTADVYRGVDLDWLRHFQLEVAYVRVSPSSRVREYAAVNALLDSRHYLEWGNNVFALFSRHSIIPSPLVRDGITVGDAMREGLGALFGIAGYELMSPLLNGLPRSTGYETLTLVFRRVSYPLARFFHTTAGDASDGSVSAARFPPLPAGCRVVRPPFALSYDVDACTLFLDLETLTGHRIGVWAASFAEYAGGSVAPVELQLPASARIRVLGSPMISAPSRVATPAAMLRAFGEVCVRHGLPISASLSQLVSWSGVPDDDTGSEDIKSLRAALHQAWPGVEPFFPLANQTWYARMRTMSSLAKLHRHEKSTVAMFGFIQGVPAAPLSQLCKGARLMHTRAQMKVRPLVPGGGKGPGKGKAWSGKGIWRLDQGKAHGGKGKAHGGKGNGALITIGNGQVGQAPSPSQVATRGASSRAECSDVHCRIRVWLRLWPLDAAGEHTADRQPKLEAAQAPQRPLQPLPPPGCDGFRCRYLISCADHPELGTSPRDVCCL